MFQEENHRIVEPNPPSLLGSMADSQETDGRIIFHLAPLGMGLSPSCTLGGYQKQPEVMDLHPPKIRYFIANLIHRHLRVSTGEEWDSCQSCLLRAGRLVFHTVPHFYWQQNWVPVDIPSPCCVLNWSWITLYCTIIGSGPTFSYLILSCWSLHPLKYHLRYPLVISHSSGKSHHVW